jgi:hypothetical protein
MTSTIILSGVLVGLGGYVMYLHHQISIRDGIISGLVSGAIKIVEVEDE